MPARTRLDSVDAAWLRLDRPENTADVVALLTFDEPFRYDELRRLVEQRLVGRPRFQERIVSTGPLDRPAWEKDTCFTLARHLVRRRLHARGQTALQACVSEIAAEPLPMRRPLWRLSLIEGPGGGRLLVAKLHHCLADGFALVGLLLSLADESAHDEPPSRPARAFLDLPFRTTLPGWAEARTLMRNGPSIASALAGLAALAPDPPTMLKHPLSGRRRLAWSGGIPLHVLRATARQHGATVNDLLMSALTGGLRRVLGAAGEPVDALDVRALVPVNLRPPKEWSAQLGNHFGLVFLELPVHLRRATDRIEAVRRRMKDLKESPEAVATWTTLRALGLGPAALEQRVADFFTQRASLVASNVPGPRSPVHVGGHRLDRILFWVPHPVTLGLGVSLMSYAGDVRLGVRADEAVLERPAELIRGMERELRMMTVA